MAMNATLLSDVRGNLVGADGVSLVTEAQATRALQRALPIVSADLAVVYTLVSDAVTPEMSALHQELWVQKATAMLGMILQGMAACGGIAVTSGDKKVDRTKEAGLWKDLVADYESRYQAGVAQVNPASDDSLLSLTFSAVPYVVGCNVEDQS